VNVPVEFHAEHFKHSKGWVKTFSLPLREQILEDIYKVIHNTRFPNLFVFAAALNIDSAVNAEQVRRDTFEEICSRFNNFLIWEHRVGYSSKGIVIIDKNREEEYLSLLRKFQNRTKYGYLGNVVDIPYFAQSHETRMLQLADFCSYAVYRYIEGDDDSYFKIIQPRICRKPIDHKLDGFKHIIKDRNCKCLACNC
jgi:hypothetical protein